MFGLAICCNLICSSVRFAAVKGRVTTLLTVVFSVPLLTLVVFSPFISSFLFPSPPPALSPPSPPSPASAQLSLCVNRGLFGLFKSNVFLASSLKPLIVSSSAILMLRQLIKLVDF